MAIHYCKIYRQSSPTITHDRNCVGMLVHDTGTNNYAVYHSVSTYKTDPTGYIQLDGNQARIIDRNLDTVGYVDKNGRIYCSETAEYAYVTPAGVVCKGYDSGARKISRGSIIGAVETCADQLYAGAALFLLLMNASVLRVRNKDSFFEMDPLQQTAAIYHATDGMIQSGLWALKNKIDDYKANKKTSPDAGKKNHDKPISGAKTKAASVKKKAVTVQKGAARGKNTKGRLSSFGRIGKVS